MENITPWQLVGLIVGAVLALAGAVNTIGSAAEKIAKAARAAKAPNEEQNERISALEERLAEVDRKLDNDKRRLDTNDAGNRVTQLALLALLDHSLDGNNIEQMQIAKKELQQHLINR